MTDSELSFKFCQYPEGPVQKNNDYDKRKTQMKNSKDIHNSTTTNTAKGSNPNSFTKGSPKIRKSDDYTPQKGQRKIERVQETSSFQLEGALKQEISTSEVPKKFKQVSSQDKKSRTQIQTQNDVDRQANKDSQPQQITSIIEDEFEVTEVQSTQKRSLEKYKVPQIQSPGKSHKQKSTPQKDDDQDHNSLKQNQEDFSVAQPSSLNQNQSSSSRRMIEGQSCQGQGYQQKKNFDGIRHKGGTNLPQTSSYPSSSSSASTNQGPTPKQQFHVQMPFPKGSTISEDAIRQNIYRQQPHNRYGKDGPSSSRQQENTHQGNGYAIRAGSSKHLQPQMTSQSSNDVVALEQQSLSVTSQQQQADFQMANLNQRAPTSSSQMNTNQMYQHPNTTQPNISPANSSQLQHQHQQALNSQEQGVVLGGGVMLPKRRDENGRIRGGEGREHTNLHHSSFGGDRDRDRGDNRGGNKPNVQVQKYKTTLCRHFQLTNTCSLGDACSFAHGSEEKRNIDDPMPESFPGQNYVGAVHSNYKTQVCRNFTQFGACKFESNCCFAHGEDQLRELTDPLPPIPQTVLQYYPPNMQLLPLDHQNVQIVPGEDTTNHPSNGTSTTGNQQSNNGTNSPENPKKRANQQAAPRQRLTVNDNDSQNLQHDADQFQVVQQDKEGEIVSSDQQSASGHSQKQTGHFGKRQGPQICHKNGAQNDQHSKNSDEISSANRTASHQQEGQTFEESQNIDEKNEQQALSEDERSRQAQKNQAGLSSGAMGASSKKDPPRASIYTNSHHHPSSSSHRMSHHHHNYASKHQPNHSNHSDQDQHHQYSSSTFYQGPSSNASNGRGGEQGGRKSNQNEGHHYNSQPMSGSIGNHSNSAAAQGQYDQSGRRERVDLRGERGQAGRHSHYSNHNNNEYRPRREAPFQVDQEDLLTIAQLIVPHIAAGIGQNPQNINNVGVPQTHLGGVYHPNASPLAPFQNMPFYNQNHPANNGGQYHPLPHHQAGGMQMPIPPFAHFQAPGMPPLYNMPHHQANMMNPGPLVLPPLRQNHYTRKNQKNRVQPVNQQVLAQQQEPVAAQTTQAQEAANEDLEKNSKIDSEEKTSSEITTTVVVTNSADLGSKREEIDIQGADQQDLSNTNNDVSFETNKSAQTPTEQVSNREKDGGSNDQNS